MGDARPPNQRAPPPAWVFVCLWGLLHALSATYPNPGLHLVGTVFRRLRLAQGTYPDRPVKVIVALPAGGSADMIARVVRSMATILGILMKRISYSGHQGPVIECWRAQQILDNAHHFAGALNGLPQGGGHLQNLIR